MFSDDSGGWHWTLACSPAGREPASLRCFLWVSLGRLFYASSRQGSTDKGILAMGVIGGGDRSWPALMGKPFGVRPLRRRHILRCDRG